MLESVRKARAIARGEASEGFVVHVPDKVAERGQKDKSKSFTT
jgi:hypothetical protein